MTDLLTEDEHEAIKLSGELWNLLNKIIRAGGGPSVNGDVDELMGTIHQIQHAVMCNAAARAYPEKYRLLGGGWASVKLECELWVFGSKECLSQCSKYKAGGEKCPALSNE